MTGRERLALASLGGGYALRMLGLYLALPILSPYAASLPGGATFWVGMSVGAYGLAQTVLQVPFGVLSDHIGRRAAILVGLAIFALGSVLAAEARTAPLLVAARFLQGMGAISSVIVAAVADVTREEVRQRAMSMLGVAIGLSFALGVVGGPLLAARIGVPGLFHVIAFLALASAAAVLLLVREPPAARHIPRPAFRQILGVFRDPVLFRVNTAMMALHLGITSVFVVLPLQIERFLPREDLWKIYGPVIVVGLLVLVAMAEIVDRFRVDRQALLAGAACLAAGCVLLRTGFDTPGGLLAGMLVFVVGFAIVEPILPALVTHYTSAAVRGTAAGSFSMSQFFGSAMGGLAGAFFLARTRADLFLFLAGLAAVIFVMALRLPDPRRFRTVIFGTVALAPDAWRDLHRRLLANAAVRDAVYDPAGPTVQVKYVAGRVGEGELRGVVGAHGK